MLQFGLNVLNSYPESSGSSDSTDSDFGSISTQRLVETMKFMGAARSELGDPTLETNNSIRINNLANVSYAQAIRANISDTKLIHGNIIHQLTKLMIPTELPISVSLTPTVVLLP